MTPRLRKFALTAHITFSVGWLGAVVAYLALAVAALTRQDGQTVRAAWIAMELTGWYVIVPFAFASLLVGVVNALGTPWGLLRHYWVLVKFLLTAFATIILLLHMPTVSYFAGIAAESDSVSLAGLRGELIHAGGGLLVLLAVTTLSVYKPWGMTAYGRRKQHERRKVLPTDLLSYPDSSVGLDHGVTTSTPRWLYVIGIHAIGLVLLFVALHFAGVGPRIH